METASLIFPLPLAEQVAPPDPEQVQEILVSEAGKVSVTVPAPSALPALLTVMYT